MYLENHGIPRSNRMDKTKCLVGNQVKNFWIKNIIEIINAPVNDHRAIGLVERLLQTIKSRLACIKEEKLANNAFHVKYALEIIIHQLRICKQKTTKISPFKAHFGRKPNTLLSVFSTKLSNLTYENIVNHYLDEDTVTPEEILPNKKSINVYRSDIEVESGMTRATREAQGREREHRWRVSLPSIRCMPANSTERTSWSAQTGHENTRQASLKENLRELIRGSCSRLKHFESEPYSLNIKKSLENLSSRYETVT